MSTADTLPAGERVSLRSFRAGAAGDFVGFLTQHPGGAFSIAMHNIATQATSVLASDHSVAPGTGGGLLRITSRNTVFLNAGGNAVFAAQVIGGKMVQVAANIQVSDTCDPYPSIQLVSITSNEPLAADDVSGATLNTDDRSFQLRETRAGGGSGRIYTITYRARDASGNATLASAQVVVPHGQGH